MVKNDDLGGYINTRQDKKHAIQFHDFSLAFLDPRRFTILPKAGGDGEL